MSNTKLWELAFTTLPSAVKPITGKQYQGNSPKPYWIVQRLTELLGPCGIGWGMQIVQERFERLSEDDVLHVATVRLWYVLDGIRGEFEQMGQTKAAYRTSKGSLMIDEDAPKKSVTDALVKCASYLGFAGDIFSGRWDDSNYVNELRKEEAEAKKKPDPVATLSADQVSVVAGLIDESNRSESDVLAFYKVDRLSDIPAAAFNQVTRSLKKACVVTIPEGQETQA